jgi:hypothetical protein
VAALAQLEWIVGYLHEAGAPAGVDRNRKQIIEGIRVAAKPGSRAAPTFRAAHYPDAAGLLGAAPGMCERTAAG